MIAKDRRALSRRILRDHVTREFASESGRVFGAAVNLLTKQAFA
jgi:hypothetical protein